MSAPTAAIGAVHPRNDAPAKVTGGAIYTADVRLNGALAGVVRRSPHPFARIRRIDIARAAAMPGVHAVVYSGNVPRTPLDFGIKDQHLFPLDCARYKGEPLAAVAAETRAQARAAAEAIDIDFEPLTPVTTVAEALAVGAPLGPVAAVRVPAVVAAAAAE